MQMANGDYTITKKNDGGAADLEKLNPTYDNPTSGYDNVGLNSEDTDDYNKPMGAIIEERNSLPYLQRSPISTSHKDLIGSRKMNHKNRQQSQKISASKMKSLKNSSTVEK